MVATSSYTILTIVAFPAGHSCKLLVQDNTRSRNTIKICQGIYICMYTRIFLSPSHSLPPILSLTPSLPFSLFLSPPIPPLLSLPLRESTASTDSTSTMKAAKRQPSQTQATQTSTTASTSPSIRSPSSSWSTSPSSRSSLRSGGSRWRLTAPQSRQLPLTFSRQSSS